MSSSAIVKLYNYFYFSLLAIFISFLPVYLSTQGISTSKIGLMIGLGAFIGILSQPFWGFQSDKHKTIKKINLLILGIAVVLGTILFQTANFFLLFLLVGLMYFFFLPTDPLTESMNYQFSQKQGVSFGSIRMFGAIGYASSSLLVGFLAEKFGIASLAYLFLFYGAATFIICLSLPDAPVTNKPISFASLRLFFTHPKSLRFFLLVLITAIPHRTNDNFLGVYIQSLGGSTALVGQAWFIAAISEVAFFALSARFLRQGKELRWISLAAAIYTVRFLLSAWVTSPEWMVYLQLLQGLTFVIFYTAAIQYLYNIVPEEWKATGQTILAILFFGISGIIGSFLGGWIFEAFGGSKLYLVMAALSLISLFASFAIQKKGIK